MPEPTKKELQERIKLLKAEVERLQDSQRKALRAKFRIPKGRSTTPKGIFRRLVVPDTHGSNIDKAAVRAMFNDVARMEIGEVVLLGDHVDCSGFITKHRHLPTYACVTGYTYEEDIAAANTFLDELQALCPKAKIWYLEGNHERRVEQWCVDKAGNKRDAEMLMRGIAPRYLLHLAERNIEYVHTLSQSHSKGESRAVLELGKCLFVHGHSHAQNAPLVVCNNYAKSVVMGHIHRHVAFTRTTHESTIIAISDGCLCETRQYYFHDRPSHHTHGYGLQFVSRTGEFYHQHVPIVKGKSFLFAE